jgi:ABC-type transport system involved in multi-copper enzyme maturation permease subunit
MNSVILSLVLICYAGLVLVVADNRDGMDPTILVHLEMILLTLFAPMMLYGSIAGERERRSWDLLLAAPITKSQIVAGKFMGAMAALGIAFGLFQIPILIAATGDRDTNWYHLFVASLVALSFLLLVCALTIFFSARVKRGLMALGAVLGLLTMGLIVAPAFLTMAATADHGGADPTMFLHPTYVLSQLSIRPRINYSDKTGDAVVSTLTWGWPQILVYIALTLTLLAWASNTLNFAENEVKFLPQGDKNARS